MTKVGHIVVGLGASLLFKLDPIFTVLGAILPDKDILWGWGKPANRRTLWNAHRGFTHHVYLIPALTLLMVLGAFTLKFPYSYILASFCVGYMSHIFADAFTPLGIPYTSRYYPRLSIPLFKTGSFTEWILISLLAGLMFYFGQERMGELFERQQVVIKSFFGKPAGVNIQAYAVASTQVSNMTGYWEIVSDKPFNFGCIVSGGRLSVYFSEDGEVYLYDTATGNYKPSLYTWKIENERLVIDNPQLKKNLFFGSVCRTIFTFINNDYNCYTAVGKNKQLVRFCKNQY